MQTMLEISLTIATGLLGSAAILVTVRLALGPTLADRALALDLLGFLAVAFAAVLVLRTGHTALFDPAMALALVAFLATVALARFSLHADRADTPAKELDTSRGDPRDPGSPSMEQGSNNG